MTLACANNKIQELVPIVNAGALPLQTAVELFETKVNSYLAYGRWLVNGMFGKLKKTKK